MGTGRAINGSSRHTRTDRRTAGPRSAATAGPGREAPEPATTHALDENVAAIRRWEQALLSERSAAERVSDRVTTVVAGGWVLAFHLVWFGGWILANGGLLPGVAPFDPYPFPLLTLVVSLEAIFLALFVLASQNRLGRQADMRAHLDLQIDLLAEREMTAVLRLLQDVVAHLGAKTSVTAAQLRDLAATTDLPVLTRQMDRLVESESRADTTAEARSVRRSSDE